jgi:hypothetical protein
MTVEINPKPIHTIPKVNPSAPKISPQSVYDFQDLRVYPTVKLHTYECSKPLDLDLNPWVWI